MAWEGLRRAVNPLSRSQRMAALARTPVLLDATPGRALSAEAVRKLCESLHKGYPEGATARFPRSAKREVSKFPSLSEAPRVFARSRSSSPSRQSAAIDREADFRGWTETKSTAGVARRKDACARTYLSIYSIVCSSAAGFPEKNGSLASPLTRDTSPRRSRDRRSPRRS
jgi:hypothetical protein